GHPAALERQQLDTGHQPTRHRVLAVLHPYRCGRAVQHRCVGGRRLRRLALRRRLMDRTVSCAAQFARSVDAAGPTQVWAVGTVQYTVSEGGPYGPYPIGFQLAGAAWQAHQSTRDLAYFNAVTVRAAGDIIGVGWSSSSAYALRWDGTAWQPVS